LFLGNCATDVTLKSINIDINSVFFMFIDLQIKTKTGNTFITGFKSFSNLN